MQELLTKILSSDINIKLVGVAADPLIARELIKKTTPDVVTLDIMLPHMDGITFLKNLMRLHPLPVIMVSTLTEKSSAIALEALAIGAVDYLAKPFPQQANSVMDFSNTLLKIIKLAAKANVIKSIMPVTSGKKIPEVLYESAFLRKEIVVMGASTGGIEAIETVLLQLPRVFPPLLIVQHIKKEFSTAFATRIQKLYGLSIIIPENNMEILPGCIYIATGDSHLMIKKIKNGYTISLDDAPPLKNHRPSINKLFSSAAVAAGTNCIGILLTGMGEDGAQGLKEIKTAGGATIVQDKESSIVWGMPGAAVKLDAADFICPLKSIPKKILEILDNKMLGIKIP